MGPAVSASTPLRFAGYAALFDIADAGRDTIRRGAFARTSLLRAKLVAANDEFNTRSQVTATADPDIRLLMGMKDHSGAEPGAFTDDQAPSAVDPSAPAKLDVRLHLYTRCAQKNRSGSKQPGGWEERQNNVY